MRFKKKKKEIKTEASEEEGEDLLPSSLIYFEDFSLLNL